MEMDTLIFKITEKIFGSLVSTSTKRKDVQLIHKTMDTLA